MVQQLSLFGSIAQHQHELIITVLTTLAGSRPVEFNQLNMLIVPKVIVKYEPNSKTTQYEQHRLILKTDGNLHEPKSWILQANDIPSAGKRKVSLQNIVESCITLNETQSIDSVMAKLGYITERQFNVKGHKWSYGNINIELFQVFINNQPLDTGYIIKSFINAEKTVDLELLNRASGELNALKGELHGLVELDIPDRNSMDSRIGFRK
jgi:mediator of RNA polymerase II transcription subunit 18